MLYAILWLMACQPEPPPTPTNIDHSVASIVASLDEAARLHVASQDEDARTSWRRAHTEFDTIVEPVLRQRLSEVQVAEVELRFGLFRAALEDHRGSSRQDLRRLKEAIAQIAADLDAQRAETEPETEPDSTSGTEAL